MIDRKLYIPEEWASDTGRRKGAGIPESLSFQTKPQLVVEMIQEATASGLPYTWVTGDCVYGDYRDIRLWLEKNQKCYVMSVSGKEYVCQGFKQDSIGIILKSLPSEGWFEAGCDDGSKGARVYDWITVEIDSSPVDGWKRVLLVRRSKSKPGELRAYICYAPTDTTEQQFVGITGIRWTVETCFKESKSEVGLDQYEVRSYERWYKHITFAYIALALLTVISSQPFDMLSIQQHNPSTSSFDEFKNGSNLRV